MLPVRQGPEFEVWVLTKSPRKCFILGFPCTEEALEGLLAKFRGLDSFGSRHDEWSSEGEAHEQKVGEGL